MGKWKITSCVCLLELQGLKLLIYVENRAWLLKCDDVNYDAFELGKVSEMTLEEAQKEAVVHTRSDIKLMLSNLEDF